MSGPKVLVFAGSTREGSFNKKLARVAVKHLQKAGAEPTYIDLRDLPLPLYDGDLESAQGIPENAMRLKTLFKSHDAILISTPEYNSSIPGVLKNMIDWVSRPTPNEKPFEPFEGKVCALFAASPGALGGVRSLQILRLLMANMKVELIGDVFGLAKADQAFTPDGDLKDDRANSTVQTIVEKLVRYARK